jgi:hypothetical protein
MNATRTRAPERTGRTSLSAVVAVLACSAALFAAETPAQGTAPGLKDAHERHHRWVRDTRSSTTQATLGVGVPFLKTRSSQGLLTTAELACRASAIVVGSVSSVASTVASTGDFIFSDYTLSVEEVLKPRYARSLARQITVTRVGGEVGSGRGRKTFRSNLLPPLDVGRRYLLFLSPVEGTHSFAADIPGGTLVLSGSGDAEQVDGASFARDLPGVGQHAGETAVVAAARAAVERGCPR